MSIFKRFSNLIKGFFSMFVSKAEKSNPRALIEVEKENLRKQIANFNDNLATHAGYIERLRRQIQDNEKKEKELTAKIAAYLKVGNRTVAGQLALELQNIKAQLEENRQQEKDAEAAYKKMVKTRDMAINEAKLKIEKLKRMISETEMLEAQAELQEMASGMISEIGGTGDTLDRVEQNIQERRDKAAGRARVAKEGIDFNDIELKEAEQEAMAEMALAEFESAYGFKSPAPQPTEAPKTKEEKALDELIKSPEFQPPPKKELGPQE
jgi:phage shock protein A